MVILLCSTPRRGIVAVATHGTPSGYASKSKQPSTFVPSSSVNELRSQLHFSYPYTIDDDPLERAKNLDWVIEEKQEPESKSEPFSSSLQSHRSRSLERKNMTATPTYGHSCFPFAVNCRFSKTFFGVPKKCGYCQKIIVGTGFACQNCRFRCHKRCIMIGRGPQVCLRPKPCSLSRLPPGDEALISKLLKESEINCNDMDSVFVESEQEYDPNLIDVVNSTMTSTASSRHPSRPSLANSSSFGGGIRSVAPSLTTSEEPGSSFPPSPQPSASPSISNPSSPVYPSHLMVNTHQLCPPPRQTQRQIRRQQQQRDTNMLLMALAAGVERRPSASSSKSSSSRQHQKSITSSETQQQPTIGLMDRFFKLFPSWSSGNKENNVDVSVALVNHLKTTPRSSSIISAASSVSMAVYSTCGETCDETKPPIPRAVSASDAVSSMPNGMMKRPHTLSACSASSNNGCSGGGGGGASRTPVDEFNYSILEDLFASSQAANNISNNNSSTGSCTRSKATKFLRRKLLWAKHIAGERSCRSQDCVTITDCGRGPVWNKIRARSATFRAKGTQNNSGHNGSPNGRLNNPNSTLLNGGRFGDEQIIEETHVRERLANTWPLSGLHINHGEQNGQQSDERTVDCLETCDSQEFNYEEHSDESRHRQSGLSDLGEWTIPYNDLELVECLYECRNMTTYKGRWHGDVMIHTFDMGGDESDRLMRSFLDDVRTLTKIRHENVALFMGASIEAPKVAVVTSIRKGDSLYDAVHVECRRISQHVKLNIIRQVAQGMGYLHAKGIVLKTLTSKSIYLECKVKISTLDEGAPLKKNQVVGAGCVRRGHLTYVSPELMKTLRVEPPALVVAGMTTKESDVYAFGTILYELYAGDFPFAQLEPEAVIYAIGSEQRQDLERVRCNVAMKSLIEDCWSPDPTYRPSFTEVLKELQHTAALHKKHSSSVPEKLNKAGLNRSPYNY